ISPLRLDFEAGKFVIGYIRGTDNQIQLFSFDRIHDLNQEVIEIGILLAADLSYNLTGSDAVLPCCGSYFDAVDHRWNSLLTVSHVNENKASEAENDVHGDAGGDDGHALANGLVLK